MSNIDEFFNNLETETSTEYSQEQLEEQTNEQTSEEEYSAVEETEGEEQEEGGQEESQAVTEKKFAGRFKSVEDLEKAYKALQARDTKTTQLLQQMQTQHFQQTQPVPQQPQMGTPSVPPELANNPQFVQLARTNPQQAMQVINQYHSQQQAQQYQQQQSMIAPLAQQMRNLSLQQEVLMLKTLNTDFDEVAGDLPVVFNENPWLWTTPQPVATAFKLAKANKVSEAINTASAVAKQEFQQKQQQKKVALAERQQAKVPTKAKTPEQEIVDSILGAGGGKHSFF